MSNSPQKFGQDDEESRKFLLGVVEGFYGRPFTSEQRKNLFKKLKKFGHQLYIYAPKDDLKHRAAWRELYTVEEGEHLQGLINAAKSSGILFFYALSPGLDITYSSLKDTACLKRKLDQVNQLGCQNFALLFDDIDSEMSKADKEIFQSFAHAQVSVSNEIYNHLSRIQSNCFNFLFCPTQYCSSRAVPNVVESEYLNTIGQKLLPNIDILWTGNKVISKIISVEDVLEINEVLRRKVMIWDNLHANDFDQKRIFLGPYCGRDCELIPLLRGVVTNPNCEFHGNTIAIHTLAQWSRCESQVNVESISDIKLETENDDCDETKLNYLTERTYHPRVALQNAIRDWLDDFFEEKKVYGRMIKPHPGSALTPIVIPPIPKINTCMSLTLPTATSPSSSAPISVPEVPQLQALAEICSAVPVSNEALVKASVMNSLVSNTKVVTTNAINAPLLATIESNVDLSDKIMPSTADIMEIEKASLETEEGEAMDCGTPKHTLSDNSSMNSEPTKEEHDSSGNVNGKNLTPDDNDKTEKSQLSDDVVMVDSNNDHEIMQDESLSEEEKNEPITYDDVLLLCDLFYLPFEHGKQGLNLLNEFHWLKMNAFVLSERKKKSNDDSTNTQEWLDRSKNFLKLCDSVYKLMRKIALCVNREIAYDLYTYTWEMSAVVSICDSYIRWLELGNFPQNANSFIQGNYTWFSKGWKETFMSGEQEPWIFRGGLIVDIQRLIPIDSANDLFIYRLPETTTLNFFHVRPYNYLDESEVYKICHRTCFDGNDCTNLFPQSLQDIAADRLVAPFVTLNPEFCLVVENGKKVLIGYACAALNAKDFYRSQETLWLPIAREKYPLSLLEMPEITPAAKDAINWFHNFKYDCIQNVLQQYPSIVHCAILKDQMQADTSIAKRLTCVLLAALRTSGSSGCHVTLNKSDSYMQEFYGKLGFTEIYEEGTKIILGRNF
ncbi:hypothetical protein PVAND_002147 [Polypedilum vanderplanki]|uniref:protein O-GlcNAcase n=1 Tax=Polypedilum vanderplanki TaxID=319348 RepID=A0A9J6BQF1_POLVA|nr:hypothetical protein PVAND_002147 [Polypedilum vanderplanki]